ncbi:MAG: hypothetical protein ACRDKY_03235 [Solirubrobacteraceae bacterium]
MSSRRVEWARSTAATGLDLPEHFGCACLLLVLNEGPAGWQELCDRMRRLGLPAEDPARVDRALQELERVGFVWADDAAAIRCAGGTYGLTFAGSEQLGLAREDLRGTRALLSRFLARCGERIVQ